MYSLIKYIHNIFNSYDSCSDFYSKELSMFISWLEIFNFIFLCLILLIIFIRFLIIRYTLKRIIFFIIKRLFFTLLVFGLVTLLSNPIYCENSVISKLFDTNTKKVCIATLAITGCYLSYKYVPIYYKTVISHQNYTQYLQKKKVYNIELKEYNDKNEIYLKSLGKLDKHKKIVIEYNSDILLFNNILDNFCSNFSNLKKTNKFNLIFDSEELNLYNNILNNFKYNFNLKLGMNGGSLTEFYDKLLVIYTNLNSSAYIIKDLSNSGIKYKVSDSLYDVQNSFFKDFENLFNFYYTNLIPKMSLLNNKIIYNENDVNICINLMKELNFFLDKTIISSNLLFSDINNIKTLKVLIEPVEVITSNIYELNSPPNFPMPIKSIDFPLENLEGFRYIGINVGYVVFYPVLYSSNKILGTCNPLSSQSFVDAISYLISLIKFF